MCPGDYDDEGGAQICALGSHFCAPGSPFCAPGGLVRFSVLEARDLLGKKEDVEGFQDSWAFDRLPYADLAQNSSPPPSEVFDTTSEVFDNDISKDQRDNIFFRHFDFRPRRITKEEHMKSALESNATSEASGNNNVMI